MTRFMTTMSAVSTSVRGLGEIHHPALDTICKPNFPEQFASGIFIGGC